MTCQWKSFPFDQVIAVFSFHYCGTETFKNHQAVSIKNRPVTFWSQFESRNFEVRHLIDRSHVSRRMSCKCNSRRHTGLFRMLFLMTDNWNFVMSFVEESTVDKCIANFAAGENHFDMPAGVV